MTRNIMVTEKVSKGKENWVTKIMDKLRYMKKM